MVEYINVVYGVFFFIVGTLFGSFFSLATYRLPRKLDIVKTRSFCPVCKHNLGFWDCFPILSYVTSFGKCRYCKCNISPRYLLLEVINGFIFLFAYLFIGISWQLFAVLACYIYLVLVIGSDIMKAKMTNEEILEAKNKSSVTNKKRAALTVEILIAFLLFVVYFIVTSNTVANYTKTLGLNLRRAEAMNLCMNLINEQKAQEFSLFTEGTSKTTKQIEGILYNCNITTSEYIKDTVKYDNAYDVNVSVEFTYLGEDFSYDLSFLKVNE
jgi:hypothetical protein